MPIEWNVHVLAMVLLLIGIASLRVILNLIDRKK